MYNPTRRNKNIGTGKQGYKQNNNNKMTIPHRYTQCIEFYENLTQYQTVKKVINDHEFLFFIEQTKPNYAHACSIDNIERIITCLPKEDYGDLKYIVLRHGNRKICYRRRLLDRCN